MKDLEPELIISDGAVRIKVGDTIFHPLSPDCPRLNFKLSKEQISKIELNYKGNKDVLVSLNEIRQKNGSW